MLTATPTACAGPELSKRCASFAQPVGLAVKRLGGRSSVIEQELLGIEQDPNEIFVGQLGVLSLLHVTHRGGRFVGSRLAAEGQQVQFADLLRVRPAGVGGQHCRAPVARRQFTLDLAGIQQVQALRQIRVARSFALAGAARLGAAEDGQEVRIKAAIRQRHRARAVGDAVKATGHRGHLVDGIQQDFGVQPLREVPREVLFVVRVPAIGLRT